MKDRWKEHSIGENLNHDQQELMVLGKKNYIKPADMEKILRINKETYDQLEKAVKMGKILQKLLLRHMSKEAISKAIYEEIIQISIPGGKI